MKPKLGLEMRPADTQEVQLICNCCRQPYYPNKVWEDQQRAIIFGAAVSLSGKIGADGKTFIDKDNKSWTVTNPEVLKGHEGHEVTLQAHVDAAKNEIHVVSVKMAKEKK
jgi:hypothetical protein